MDRRSELLRRYLREGVVDTPKLQTGPGAWKEFISGTVWKDLVAVIESRLLSIYDGFEFSNVSDIGAMGKEQGVVSTLKEVLDLPHVLMEEAEIQSENEKLNRKQEENDGRR